MVKDCYVTDLKMMAYTEAVALQQTYVQKAFQEKKNFVLLGEHPAVLTLGRLSKKENVLIPEDVLSQQGIDLINADRGGDVTLHAPGQLVMYPIFCLDQFGKDLKKYLVQLEQVAIDLLNDFGIVANRLEGKTGVWVQDKKIASIGIGVKKWVTWHGIGINISTDLRQFSFIKPCGLDIQMTSLVDIKKESVSMKEVKSKALFHLADIFNLKLVAEREK